MTIANGHEMVEQAIGRAREETFSKQPRLRPTDTKAFVARWMRLVKEMNLTEPPYGDPARNAWLSDFTRREPHLAGVLSSVVSVDKNRSWYMTGGRNQVIRFTNLAHNWENGKGWRWGASKASTSFWSTDMGAIVEEGRDGEGGPLRALYHVDPTRCTLSGDFDHPLEYRPLQGKPQKWSQGDFFRVASMPAIEEKYNDLGFCAVSRALELAKIMVAVYQHDQEQLGARMPNGLLLLQNVGEEQWQTALDSRNAKLDGLERAWFGGVMVLAHEGMEQMDAKLVGLSQLPIGFDHRMFTDLLMFGIALSFGYDIREFWPVSSGALGTATETETQHRKAGSKGALDFGLGFQEQFQAELPDSLEFAFEERDADGELRDAGVALAKAQVVTTLYESGLRENASLISRDEARSLLANSGVIPPEWTEVEEEAIATDTEVARLKRLRERALELPQVWRAIERFPEEPIVRYAWPQDRMITLWDSGASALHRKSFPVARATSAPIVYSADGEGAWIETGHNSISPIDPKAPRTMAEYEERKRGGDRGTTP